MQDQQKAGKRGKKSSAYV